MISNQKVKIIDKEYIVSNEFNFHKHIFLISVSHITKASTLEMMKKVGKLWVQIYN